MSTSLAARPEIGRNTPNFMARHTLGHEGPASTYNLNENIVGSRFFVARSTRRFCSLANKGADSTVRAPVRALVISEKAVSQRFVLVRLLLFFPNGKPTAALCRL
jgi:hypothetical protein